MKISLTEREQKYYLTVFKAEKLRFSSKNGVNLVQFADVHCKSASESNPSHKQSCHEITFVYGGEGEIIQNNKRLKIKNGQIHLCFKGDSHQIIPSNTSILRFYCVGFELDEQNPISKLFERAKEKINETGNAVLSNCSYLLNAFQSVLKAVCNDEIDDVSSAVAVNTLNFIFSSVFEEFLSRDISEQENPSNKDSLLFYITSYLKNNIYNIDALSYISEDTGYSYSYLSHLFSKKMGQSLKKFFTTLRMETATELLKAKSVTEVSNLLGYSSIHAFTRAYKSYFGNSPSSVI